MTPEKICQKKMNSTSQPIKIKLVAVNAKFIHSCLALFYLRHELQLNLPQVEIEILQLTINDNYYESFLQVTDTECDAIFFSAAIWNSDRISQLIRDCHTLWPECSLIVGGPQGGVVHGERQDCCTLVAGEIEAVGTNFYTDLENNQLSPKYSGSFLKQQPTELAYPYCDEDFSTHLANKHIYYESSRGCPHSCTYCLSATEKGLFHKPLEQVKKELLHLLTFKPKVIRFVDRTFNDSPKRALAIWQFLIEHGGTTLFHFEIAPERFTEEMFTLLNEVECDRFQFEIGIQSTHQPTLEAINRSIDGTRVHEIITRLMKLGTIHLHVDLILGLPFDTRESFAQSFRDVFNMGAHYIQMGLLKILPDTPICHSGEEFGYQYCSSPPYSVISNSWLNHEEIRELYWFSEGVEKFYNNRYFPSFWKYLRQQQEDGFNCFLELIKVGSTKNFLLRAVTMELLCEIVVESCQKRKDFSLILELLRFDWLRCGFRQMPQCLALEPDQEDSRGTRDLLYTALPPALEGIYTKGERNHFFRKSTFLRLSQTAAEFYSFDSGVNGVRIAIMSQRESTIQKHNRAVVLQRVEPKGN